MNNRFQEGIIIFLTYKTQEKYYISYFVTRFSRFLVQSIIFCCHKKKKKFKRQLFAGNVIRAKLLSDCVEEDEVLAFSAKVVQEKEIKLKEFNFKLLHNILPCNKNLAKWKIKPNDRCDVCGQSQTIEHLLYSCIYVKPLWRVET